jgi:MOSC domain-containing protein YiiM
MRQAGKLAMADGTVIALAKAPDHGFSKRAAGEIRIIAGLGVEGDAHQGAKVKHLSRVAADPSQPNLRQVHLIHAELFDELSAKGFNLTHAQLGENITTRGIDLLGLPRGTLLRLGTEVVLEVTGLRNPCAQIENFRKGLLAAVLDRGAHGEIVRKTGIMAIALTGGTIRIGDPITAEFPPPPHLPLDRV